MPPTPPRTALLIVDMINFLDFPQGRALLRQALPAARRIAALKRRCKRAGCAVIYANDNYGQWHADFRELVAACRQPACLGAPLAERLLPEPDDYYVLKPKHSAFHATPLGALIGQCAVERVVIAGISADACVLATAFDAHMRELQVAVPSDCVASPSRARTARALKLISESLRASTAASPNLRV